MRRYGWKKDKPDERDFKFALVRGVSPALPPFAYLDPLEPPIWDQGDLGSCTGHGCVRAMMMARRKAGLPDVMLSRLMAYYTAREIEGDTADDAGAQIRDVVKGAAKSGVAPESKWPYDITKFAMPPPGDVWTDALSDCVRGYSSLDNEEISQLKSCLAGGDPFIFGFNVPSSFEGDAMAATGVMTWSLTEAAVGGHCVVAVGYDDTKNAFLIANSWGTSWGDPAHPGHFWMPYSFMTSAAVTDVWNVTATGYGPQP